MTHPLAAVPASFQNGQPIGITSVCSAHPVVIEAALRLAHENHRVALIEATCNQVNQDGGYTGMTPADFRRFVEQVAKKVGISPDNIILGGDHLGPNPWKHLPADQAMAKAENMIAAFARAGFTKLHLDTSMGCAGEPTALPDRLTAERAARLASVAEANPGPGPGPEPVYIIGTEVPVPGGALEELDHLEITSPDAVLVTYKIHRDAFGALGLQSAFARVIGLVVQPGVEFSHTDVIAFDPTKTKALTGCLAQMSGLVFEAHSTDYQTAPALGALVKNGFAILKVGPWLTFAVREALYGLDAIADVLEGRVPQRGLMTIMENVMTQAPGHWQKYYAGDQAELLMQRHFSYSDRIRYYWPSPEAHRAVSLLRERLAGKRIPSPLLSQFVPGLGEEASGMDMDMILIAAVQNILRQYESAASPQAADVAGATPLEFHASIE